MLVENQLIRTHWNSKNKEHYSKLGYVYTGLNTELLVKAEDLPKASNLKVKVVCDYCGKEYEKAYGAYLLSLNDIHKTACAHCVGKKQSEIYALKFPSSVSYKTKSDRTPKYTKEEKELIYDKLMAICLDKGYSLLTPVHKIGKNISIICPTHGKVITNTELFLKNKLCGKCSRKELTTQRHRETLEQRQNLLYDKIIKSCNDKGYTLLSEKNEIINNTTYIKYICPKHGEKLIRINNLINGRGCPECATEKRRSMYQLSPNEVEDKIKAFGGIVLNKEDYINNTTKNLKIICNNCGKVFLTSLRNYVQHEGQVCETCAKIESMGERKVRHYLEKNHINYERQKKYPDCRNINPLPFDFFLPESNTIIEFDGRQHFEETGMFTSSLKETKFHDSIKNNYCKENNIYLIRIPYWDYSKIDNILDNELKSHEDIV